MSKSLYFARQPILDLEGRTYAYELLYRSSLEQEFAPIKDNRSATAQVLVNTLNMVSIHNILGDAFAFININEEILMDEMIFSIPKEKFVLEILETVIVNEEVINRIIELKETGYRFALDDADCTKEYILNFQPIFKYIDVLKLDITLLDEGSLPQFLALFKRFNLKILAEKVETKEEFEKYKALGCDYFQGFFFAHPDIIENRRLDPEQLVILDLIRKLHGNFSINDIAYQFGQNVALTLQLLRFINCAAFSFRTTIKSIRQAIILLGPHQLRSWLLLISYANPSSGPKGVKNPLLHLAQTRANMMQTISKAVYKENLDEDFSEKASFTGLLSLIESLLQAPMQDILRELNVDVEILEALVFHKGELGTIFKLVYAIELFDTKRIDTLLLKLSLDRTDFSAAVQDAYRITEEFTAAISL